MMPPKVAVTRPVVTAACHCPVSAKPISVPTTVDDAIPIASDHRNARCVSLNAEWLMISGHSTNVASEPQTAAWRCDGYVIQNGGRLSTTSRSVPPAIAVMQPTMIQPSMSICLVPAEMTPEIADMSVPA